MASANHVPHDTKHDLPHEGPIKTPKQLVLALLFAFIVPIVVIMLLVTFVAADHKPAAGSDAMTPEAIARRLEPIGKVEIRDVSDPGALATGDKVYTAQCAACHATGAAGAPKLGDTAAWGPRLASGYETLLQSALKGKGNMPPQSGGDFTDFEIARAVVYMANQSGGKLPEPKGEPAAAQVADAAASPPAAGAGGDAAKATADAAKAAAAAVAAAPAPKAQEQAADAVPALYAQSCQVCHAAGVAGAPKLGDKQAWAPRIAQGMDVLMTSVIKGKGAMPPRGGSTASDADLKQVLTYMVNASK
jgi:cytochrome c5